MPSYHYRDSHVKDKTVSPTVLSLTWESPYLGKKVFILRRGPGPWNVDISWKHLLFDNRFVHWKHKLSKLKHALWREIPMRLHLEFTVHYIGVTSASWLLKSPAPQLFVQELVQTNNKENIKVPHNWPLVGGIHLSPVDCGFPSQRVNNGDKVSMPWHHHDMNISSASPIKHPAASLTLCEGTLPVTGGFPSQRARDAGSVSI